MALDEDIVFLGRIPTFRVLGREAMRILAISAQQVELLGGEELFEEGEPADGGYVVVRGAVELKSVGERTGSIVARKGTLIGETALIVFAMRPATATALEPTTLLRIPRSVFLRTLEGEPGSAEALRDMMQARLKSTLDDLDLVVPLFAEPEREDEREN
jgi:CRP-like cAMP-binding protein